MNALHQILGNPTMEAVGWTLLHFLWQGAAAALLLAATIPLLRRASSHLRYAAVCLIWTLMALSPAATFCVIYPNQLRSPNQQQVIVPIANEPHEQVATTTPLAQTQVSRLATVEELPRPNIANLPVETQFAEPRSVQVRKR